MKHGQSAPKTQAYDQDLWLGGNRRINAASLKSPLVLWVDRPPMVEGIPSQARHLCDLFPEWWAEQKARGWPGTSRRVDPLYEVFPCSTIRTVKDRGEAIAGGGRLDLVEIFNRSITRDCEMENNHVQA